MNSRASHFCTIILFAGSLLGGCTTVKEKLGLSRPEIDEYAVIDETPLAIPPGINLRPPCPGEERPQTIPTTKAAQKLFGADGKAVVPAPTADDNNSLLRNAHKNVS